MTREEVLSQFAEGSGAQRVAVHFFDGIEALQSKIEALPKRGGRKDSVQSSEPTAEQTPTE